MGQLGAEEKDTAAAMPALEEEDCQEEPGACQEEPGAETGVVKGEAKSAQAEAP